MSERYVTIKEDELWLVVPDVAPEYDDGFIAIRDDTGGDTLVHRDEIPALITALQEVKDAVRG